MYQSGSTQLGGRSAEGFLKQSLTRAVAGVVTRSLAWFPSSFCLSSIIKWLTCPWFSRCLSLFLTSVFISYSYLAYWSIYPIVVVDNYTLLHFGTLDCWDGLLLGLLFTSQWFYLSTYEAFGVLRRFMSPTFFVYFLICSGFHWFWFILPDLLVNWSA